MKKIKNKKLALIIVIVAAVALVGGGYFLNRSSANDAAGQAKAEQENIDLSPATAEDARRAADNKERIVKEQAQQKTTQANNLKPVTPVITYAGQYGAQVEVGAYASGVYENGGTCEAVFKKNSAIVKKQVNAVKGATSMDCPVMAVAASELNPKGQWTVTVSYYSPSASGTSEARQVEVR